MIVGITRLRNEALILEDTLGHFLGLVDRIVAYDDCSTDATPEILRGFERVHVIRGGSWSANQWRAETQHRAECLAMARNADMVLCFDADERIEGDLPQVRGGYRFGLFDGYMTPEHCKPYTDGPLVDLKRKWGPERRDILMFFDPRHAVYEGPGRREPIYSGNVQDAPVKVRHYGKCLSVDHWEHKCAFYARYFARWAEKWEARKGKAIHTESDFGNPLLDWNKL